MSQPLYRVQDRNYPVSVKKRCRSGLVSQMLKGNVTVIGYEHVMEGRQLLHYLITLKYHATVTADLKTKDNHYTTGLKFRSSSWPDATATG